MRIVIALGGNALLNPARKNSYPGYLQTVRTSCQGLANLAKKHELIITHGNGPQVGDIMLQQEKAKTLRLPLDVDVAETQGQIGYLLQQGLHNAWPKANVVCLLNQVLVDKNDSAFRHPSKPVGPFYTPRQAHELKGRYHLKKIGQQYRRVVPSPQPKEIIELGIISSLAKSHIVIACGGGGIPVVREKGIVKGVEAVIDKDLTACLLAKSLHADLLLILTDTEGVYLNYGTAKQKLLRQLKVREAQRLLQAGQFPDGSMGPKVRAAMDFAATGRQAVIAHLTDLAKAVNGKAGTSIK
ncbi:MAG: carbamate kinase [Candidatus Aenigmarchaeota archaeon]|nr:carbamate kinase [Candidatus Aenigmarchaeota archaeon]